MDDLENLARTLLKCKSYNKRQQRLSESFDRLSFDYPKVYYELAREIKRRDIESNNLCEIFKWLNTPDSYVKLHEALILVKNTNTMAKEQYADRLKDLLFQTIEYGTNVDKMVKICHLIEKCAHLKSIYE